MDTMLSQKLSALPHLLSPTHHSHLSSTLSGLAHAGREWQQRSVEGAVELRPGGGGQVW